jgi:tetratricopeptide (TPR) repeat protein
MFTVGFVTFTISIIDINDIPNILVTLKFVSLFLMITSAVYFIGSEIYILRMKNISRDIENFLSDNDVDRALASNPCSEFSVYVSGKILKKIGIHTEILRDVSPKKRKSKFYDAWTKKGGLALADKNYPEAIKCLKRAIYIDSMYLDAWLKLFDTHIKLRKVDDAEKCRVNILKIISRILERFIERDNTPVAYHLILLDYARLFARALNKKILSISK